MMPLCAMDKTSETLRDGAPRTRNNIPSKVYACQNLTGQEDLKLWDGGIS